MSLIFHHGKPKSAFMARFCSSDTYTLKFNSFIKLCLSSSGIILISSIICSFELLPLSLSLINDSSLLLRRFVHRDDSPVLTEEFVTLVRQIGYKFTGNYFYTYFYLTLPPVDIVTVPHSPSCIFNFWYHFYCRLFGHACKWLMMRAFLSNWL